MSRLGKLVEGLTPRAAKQAEHEAAASAAYDKLQEAKRLADGIQKRIAEKSAERTALDDRLGTLFLEAFIGREGAQAKHDEAKRRLATLDDEIDDLAKGHAAALAKVAEREAERRKLAFAGEEKVLRRQCKTIGEHLDGMEEAVASLVKHWAAALDWQERLRASWPRDYRLLNDALFGLHSALAAEMHRQSVNQGVPALPGAAEAYLGYQHVANPQSFPSLIARWEEATAHLLRLLTGEPVPQPAPAASSSAVEAQPGVAVADPPPPAVAPRPTGEPGPGASAEEVNAWRRAQAEAEWLSRQPSTSK